MPKEVKRRTAKSPEKRTYRSELRSQQAQETRRAIRAAAEELFLANGYAATSITAIAEAAGVAPETVYAIFKNKRSLLLEIEDVAIVGDDAAVPLFDREFVDAARAEPDQRKRMQILLDAGLDAAARPFRFDSVMRSAADSDPELAKIRDERRAARYADNRRFVQLAADAGPFVIPFDDAVDLVHMLTSAEVFNILVGQCGWSIERWKTTIANLIEKIALPPAD
jgi:AcrR family transcriptional regulator